MIIVYFLAVIGYFSLGDTLMTRVSNHFTVDFIENIGKWYFYLPLVLLYFVFWPVAFLIDIIAYIMLDDERRSTL